MNLATENRFPRAVAQHAQTATPSSRTDQRLDTGSQPAPPALTATGGRNMAPAGSRARGPVPAATTFYPRPQVDWIKVCGLLAAAVFVAGVWLFVLYMGGVL